MYASTVRSHQPARSPRRNSRASAVGHHASPALALPSLGKLPTRIPSDLARKRWARVALHWLKAGYIAPEASPNDPEALVREAVKECARRHGGLFQRLELGFTVDTQPSDDSREEPSDFAAELIVWTGGFGLDEYRFLQPVLGNTPRALAETALYWLHRASYELSLNILTPGILRDECSNILWYGEITQKAYEASRKDYGEDEECGEMLTPKTYGAAFPAWVLNPKEKQKEAALKASAARSGKHQELAACVLALSQALNHRKRWPQLPEEARSIPAPAGLRWTPEDICARAIDDIEHYVQQDEYGTDILSMQDIPSSDAEFAEWLEGFIVWLNTLGSVDRLIGLISEASQV
jgi:PRTRC genetic system protein F